MVKLLKILKNFIYLIDRIFLRRTISKFVNIYLLNYKINKVEKLSKGFFKTNLYFEDSLLDQLADKYKTDKGGKRHIKKGNRRPHTYTSFYDTLFGHCRKEIKKVFECGIGSNNEMIASNMSSTGSPGASLRMWQEYFENADIIGADIDSDIFFNEGRIRCFFLDQLSSSSINFFWKSLEMSNFDLMIDDGLHTFDAAVNLFNGSFRFLKPGGIYVIEDISPWNLDLYVDWLSNEGVNFSVIPLFHLENDISDDLLVVIRK
jgi:hypothetical protein